MVKYKASRFSNLKVELKIIENKRFQNSKPNAKYF